MPRSENYSDLRQKYNSTYIKYDGELVIVQEFDAQRSAEDDSEEIFIEFSSDQKAQRVPFNENKLEEIHCDSKFFNTHEITARLKPPSGARLFVKNPKRQWHRSLCTSTGMITSPLFNDLYAAYGIRHNFILNGFNCGIVKSLINPSYLPLDRAIELLPKLGAIAVDPMYCVVLSSIHETNPLLMSLFGFIGELDVDKKTIMIHHKPAIQEVSDFIRRTNQHGWKLNA